MKAVVVQADFKVIGRSREEALDLMDQVKFSFLNDVGGAPWVAVNDDVQKQHMPQAMICDADGFVYQGLLTLQYGGPFVYADARPMHEGHKLQLRSEDDGQTL